MAICHHEMAVRSNGHLGLISPTKHAYQFHTRLKFFHTFLPHKLRLLDTRIRTPMGSPKVKAKWDNNRDEYLVKLLLEQARNGEKADSGFKAKTWRSIGDAFNKKWSPKLKSSQLQSRA